MSYEDGILGHDPVDYTQHETLWTMMERLSTQRRRFWRRTLAYSTAVGLMTAALIIGVVLL